MGLPFERVSPRVEFLDAEGVALKSGRSASIWGALHVSVPGKPQEYDRIEATETASFVVWPGRGCETGWFGLARHPQDDPRAREETGGNWYGGGFAKTLYAAHPGAGGSAHFLKCHLGLVAVLDEARRLGFEARVTDDGDYWADRDVAALLENLHQAERRVARIVGRLTDLMADGIDGTVLAPMRSRPEFERVEAGAPPPPAPMWEDFVLELIRRTGGLRTP